jgi:hypothetical protein
MEKTHVGPDDLTFLCVSEIAEKIASRTDISPKQIANAQDVAVRNALNAHDFGRAKDLAKQYGLQLLETDGKFSLVQS